MGWPLRSSSQVELVEVADSEGVALDQAEEPAVAADHGQRAHLVQLHQLAGLAERLVGAQ